MVVATPTHEISNKCKYMLINFMYSIINTFPDIFIFQGERLYVNYIYVYTCRYIIQYIVIIIYCYPDSNANKVVPIVFHAAGCFLTVQ